MTTLRFPALSAHVLVSPSGECHAARRVIETMLHERYELEHTTLQVDDRGGELLQIESPEQHHAPSHRH